jgi:hypothetical protein
MARQAVHFKLPMSCFKLTSGTKVFLTDISYENHSLPPSHQNDFGMFCTIYDLFGSSSSTVSPSVYSFKDIPVMCIILYNWYKRFMQIYILV